MIETDRRSYLHSFFLLYFVTVLGRQLTQRYRYVDEAKRAAVAHLRSSLRRT